MTERPPDSDVASDAEAVQHALLSLHDFAGRFGDVDLGGDPRFRPPSPAQALSALAAADPDQVSHSARLAVLYDLARAGRTDALEREFRQVVESVAGPNAIGADDLMQDVRQAAAEGTPLGATASGRQLPHHVTAFVGEDICHVRTVTVDGIPATWIFSEIETDAPFDQIAGWVDPRDWPKRGPLLFKGMDIVDGGDPIDIDPSLGSDHWHAVFHEKVQIIGTLNTLLHCDYWRNGSRAAGMTYGLSLSLDNAIDVDQGFLSVTELGQTRRVKALKIVGFTNDDWDRAARTVCPVWTDWVRQAVEGGTHSTPRPGPAGGGFPGRETLDAWIDFFGDSARTYFDIFADATSRAAFGQYGSADWIADNTRYWSQLAKDWARAWSYGMDLVDEVAKRGLAASFMPPGSPSGGPAAAMAAMAGAAGAAPGSAGGAGTTIPVPGLPAGVVPVCSDLRSIEAAGPAIASGDVAVVVEQLDERTRGVRLRTAATVPAGLYVGDLQAPDGSTLVPVQLYVSRAGGAGRV